MRITELVAEAERRRAVPVLEQLWEDRSPEAIVAWTGESDYHLFGAIQDDDLLGVAGVRIDDFLHHRRHAWLYDLVVDAPRRGEGIGTALLEHVEGWARDHNCEYVALASPLEKASTHDYYEQRDFETWGYVIEKDL